MAYFRRPSWYPKDIPDLAFGDDKAIVDIGFLGGEDHRQAFATIFERMLTDNWQVLASCTVTAIRNKRPIQLVQCALTLPFGITELGQSARQFALLLYDSRNEEIVLQLTCPAGEAELGVRFDNPAFWFQSAAV